MKKITSVLIVLMLVLVFASCGSKDYTGTWYDINDPDNILELSDDGSFEIGKLSGKWSVEGDVLTIGDEKFEIGEFHEEIALTSPKGNVWIKDFDTAVAAYEERQQKLEEHSIEDDSELSDSEVDNLKDSLAEDIKNVEKADNQAE